MSQLNLSNKENEASEKESLKKTKTENVWKLGDYRIFLQCFLQFPLTW